AYEVKDGDQVYVRASTVIVPFDFEAQRPRRITQEEREFLQEYTDDGESRSEADADADEDEAVAA
ncbi:acyl-CoA thioesterase, partial [Streptomyces hirsutus]